MVRRPFLSTMAALCICPFLVGSSTSVTADDVSVNVTVRVIVESGSVRVEGAQPLFERTFQIRTDQRGKVVANIYQEVLEQIPHDHRTQILARGCFLSPSGRNRFDNLKIWIRDDRKVIHEDGHRYFLGWAFCPGADGGIPLAPSRCCGYVTLVDLTHRRVYDIHRSGGHDNRSPYVVQLGSYKFVAVLRDVELIYRHPANALFNEYAVDFWVGIFDTQARIVR